MNFENIFFTLFLIWCCTNYGTVIPVLNNGVNFFFEFCKYYEEFTGLSEKEEEKEEEEEEDKNDEEEKKEIKYEDKYLEEIRKMSKDFFFDEKEEELKLSKYLEFWQANKEEYLDKVEEIKEKLREKENEEKEYCICENDNKETKLLLETELAKLKVENETGEQEIMKMIDEKSRNFVIDQRLEKLKNCSVMEYTPLGNVLMMYDKERETFKYYSDNIIPYRYLETVARKYVKQFNCRPIFVDVEEELKLAEQKWKREEEKKEESNKKQEANKKQDKEENKNLEEQNKDVESTKKNVFAKFKSYNKEAGSGKVNTAPPPKNSIPNKVLTNIPENEKLLIKERSNRYTYDGKFANFNFIKKVDRKIVDKKYGMTFADFKRKIATNN